MAVRDPAGAHDADYFASSHISFCANTGTVIANPRNFLSTTKIDIRYKGKPAHAGAAPHLMLY